MPSADSERFELPDPLESVAFETTALNQTQPTAPSGAPYEHERPNGRNP